jgi:hypothetical protein
MYEPTDIFDHASHLDHLDGNAGCIQCHVDAARVKTRETAKPCVQCHAEMIAVEPFLGKIQKESMTGMAAGYMDAMHGLCVGCHENKILEQPEEYSADFARCDYCHGDSENIDLRQWGPYIAARTEKPSAARPSPLAMESGIRRNRQPIDRLE